MQEILISEIFGPTIQGEGALVGRATVFVRTGGCDYRCSWCDSLYAVLPSYKDTWGKMSGATVLEEIQKLSGGHPILVTLSGGNPALQPLEELLDLGHQKNHTFAMETQGTKAPAWLSKLDHLVLSPKPPSSEMVFKPELLAKCIEVASGGPQISLKVVVFDEVDYQFARRINALHPTIPFYLSIGNTAPIEGLALDNEVFAAKLEWLLERCGQDGWFSPTILPQLHVLLWGNKRGV